MTTMDHPSHLPHPSPTARPSSGCPLHAVSASGPGGWAALAYGAVAYLAFVGAFGYAIGFVGNWIVPKTIDSGEAPPLAQALTTNALLLSLFVLQHTVMARPLFKRWWTRIVPASIERSTFVLAASASLGLLFWLWEPAPAVVWEVTNPVAAWGLRALSLLGYGIVFASSWMVSHTELFGLRQVWQRFEGRAYEPVGFRLVGLYKLVRHPLMLGFLVAFWSTPVMTVGHLFFAVMVTGYIRFGTWMEERDLVAEHGDRYLAYRRAVPAILPVRIGGAA